MPTETFHYGESLLIVKPDGQVLWTPPAKLASHCAMNMIRWPYDEHVCTFKLGSWTHSGKEIDLGISKNVASNPVSYISQVFIWVQYMNGVDSRFKKGSLHLFALVGQRH